MTKPQNTDGFHAFVARGAGKGKLLYPHVHEDGMYVVSPTRFEQDYQRIKTEADLEAWMLKGYRLRMSNIAEGITAPSLIAPSSIFRPVIR
ncbi:hypothetical protein NHF56_00035 [Rhizobium sp. L1K21]|nr:hypothetical protein [Rhizobium sp. L1K21]